MLLFCGVGSHWDTAFRSISNSLHYCIGQLWRNPSSPRLLKCKICIILAVSTLLTLFLSPSQCHFVTPVITSCWTDDLVQSPFLQQRCSQLVIHQELLFCLLQQDTLRKHSCSFRQKFHILEKTDSIFKSVQLTYNSSQQSVILS